MTPQVITLRPQLLVAFVWQSVVRPDLAVGVRVARPHHRTPVLEDLYGIDERQSSEFEVLLDPHVNDLTDVGDLHARKRQVMARREADHPANSALRSGD